MRHKVGQNVNFENGGTTIQIGIERFVNSPTAKVTLHVWLFLDAKRADMTLYVLKKNNKMLVAGRLELLASIHSVAISEFPK